MGVGLGCCSGQGRLQLHWLSQGEAASGSCPRTPQAAHPPGLPLSPHQTPAQPRSPCLDSRAGGWLTGNSFSVEACPVSPSTRPQHSESPCHSACCRDPLIGLAVCTACFSIFFYCLRILPCVGNLISGLLHHYPLQLNQRFFVIYNH